jgi:3-dehydroquinate dehydratase
MTGRIDVLHGVNLDMLGRRDPEHYGSLTLTELEVKVKRFATTSASSWPSSRRTTRASSASGSTGRARRATGWY